MSQAIESRKREFRAGRYAARAVMAQLGAAPRAILRRRDRTPDWPTGLTGSISHCGTACIAAMAHGGDLRALGVDLEDASELADDLVDLICTSAERARVRGAAGAGLNAKMVFCAKEAAFKAQFVLSSAMLEFSDLDVQFSEDQTRFDARFLRDVSGFDAGQQLSGRIAIGSDYILSAVEIRTA